MCYTIDVMNKSVPWNIFFVLLISSFLSVICIFPYVLTIQADLLKKIKAPVEVLILAQSIQSVILFSIAIFLGLLFTNKINFHLPVLEAIFNKGNYKKILKNIIGQSVLIGIAVAIIIYLVDIFFTARGANINTHVPLAPAWQTLLAAFYGGITEEILLRLFLMSFFIWISMKLFKKDKPTQTIVIISIVLSAIIFGLGHLPITASITTLNTIVVARAVVLNGIGGVVFGWLFWRKGLESAMIAHFTADIFLLTILPLLLK